MELKEAIEKLRTIMSKYKQIEKSNNNDHKVVLTVGYEELNDIDTVLEELDNRIPRKDIEEQINQLDLIDEYEAPNGWESEREYARNILKRLLNKE